MREKIFTFLRHIAAHNDREWFKAHRAEYDEARVIFEDMAQTLINRISAFDPEVANVPLKSTLYRFYRDTRFSSDKSPYKRHFGTYINTMGKKSFHGGYYFHIEPGNSMVACGSYWLPADVLNAVRNSIIVDIDRFRSIVEDPEFKSLYPVVGLDTLKTLPKGFPRDFPYPQYLRPKDYATWTAMTEEEILSDDWADIATHRFKVVKPLIDFINETVDDYL